MKLLAILSVTGILTFCVSVSCNIIKNDLQANIERLTRNFFDNLQEDPYLKNSVLSESSKTFIDKQVANYMALIKRTHGLLEHSLTRRSLPIEDITTLTKDYTGVYVLEGFNSLFNMKVRFPRDIALFQHNINASEVWYAAVLESKSKNAADDLVIYQLDNNKFIEIKRVPVINAIKLGVLSLSNSTYIIVAEHNALTETFHEKTGIFEFVPNKLIKIQSLETEYASDVVLWEDRNQIFMALSQYMANDGTSIVYEVDTPIFKWLGKHFDVINHIKTFGARRITPFVIGNSHFLAVANFQDNLENTNIYSEIFKYNFHTDQFESYQKIKTMAAVDVKHFSFKQTNLNENFLIVANFFEIEADGSRNYETDSIIYKYVQDYFIPFQSFKLNGAKEWLSVSGPNGEFVLLVACKFEGIKAYQYDGWKFVEAQIQYTHEAFSNGVVSMRTYEFNGKSIVVIANENDHGEMVNIFQPTFTHKKMLSKFQDGMLQWCQSNLQSFESENLNNIIKTVENAPKEDDSILELTQNAAFSNVTIGNLQAVQPNGVDLEHDKELEALKGDLDVYSKELDEIEQEVQLALHTDNTNIFHGDVHVQKLILNNSDNSFESLTTETMNGIEVDDVLKNVMNIKEGFVMEQPMEFEHIEIENVINPRIINNQPVDVLLQQNSKQSLDDLIVNGDVICEEGIVIGGKLNGISFTSENILLSNGDQSFDNFDINELIVGRLDATLINNADMSQMDLLNNRSIMIQNITTLTVERARVSGLVNNVDLQTLEQYALKTSGDQIITQNYSFDSLHVDNINVKSLNNITIPEDLVLTDGGSYILNYDVEFKNNFTADTVYISGILNNIKAVNGTLNVLLTNSSEVQEIVGETSFENVQLLNPVKLRGKIHSSKFNKTNPVVTIDEEIILTGNYVISGNVTVKELLQANDLQSTNSSHSVQRLFDKGLKINESKIPVHLNFVQQLNIQELFADKINNIDVQTFVKTGSKEPQLITGWKIFQGDVVITGPTKIENVNGINLPNLETNVLTVNGNQTLNGKYYFENIVANRISNVKSEFDGNLWENVMTNRKNQPVGGTTFINGSLEINHLEADRIHCASRINGYNFSALVNDTVFRNQNVKILGHKHFVNITVENLNVPSLDLNELPKALETAKATFEIDEDVDFPSGIVIENIIVNGNINDIPSEYFGQGWLTSTSEQIVNSDQTFDKITIFGNLFIESGMINGINIKNISEDSIKTDEIFHFTSATFSNGLTSLKPVLLDGQFESLDLNDIILSHTETEQILTDQIVFNNNVTIFGEIYFNGLISGMNLTQFCEFASFPNESPRSLYINGNVYFVKGPEVFFINNRPIQHILDNAWFTNRDTVITGVMEFDQVLFRENIVVHGLLDTVNVEILDKTYFSKSRDQNITVDIIFDDVIFENGLYAKEGMVGGAVNGINLEEFTSTALLHNFQQIFESAVYLEECEIQELQGDYVVNGLNLQTDVMRYDVNNIVTGKKVIKDVQTEKLLIDKGVKVQNVDILWWLHSLVLKSGTFHVPGKVVFLKETAFLNGISSQYLVNGMKFNKENVMLKSIPQTITGRKVFYTQESKPLQFKSLKLRGLLNGIDVYDLMNHRAYKNQNIVFNGPMYFNSNIITPNVNIEKLYQGVNVTQLLHNITRFTSIENYYESYQELLNISSAVQNSLQGQAYFVDYYKVKQVYSMIDTIVPAKLDGTNLQHLAKIVKSDQNYSIRFDVWDNEAEVFHSDFTVPKILFKMKLHYIKQIMFKGKEHWYIEHEIDTLAIVTHAGKYESSLYELTSNNLERVLPLRLHNGTQSVIVVPVPHLNKDCILMLFVEGIILYCEDQDENGEISLNEYQRFIAYNSSEATTFTIEGIPHIVIINKGQIQMQPSVDVWKYNVVTKNFAIQQIIYVASPNSVTAAFYEGNYYLAIASGHLQNAKHAGLVDIRKYNKNSHQFLTWQDINLNAPIQVEFVNLPTKEFYLYVLTENPVEPLIIFAYEGISQFQQKLIASTIPKTVHINSFTTIDNKHFIIAQNVGETRIIQAVFKGEKFDI